MRTFYLIASMLVSLVLSGCYDSHASAPPIPTCRSVGWYGVEFTPVEPVQAVAIEQWITEGTYRVTPRCYDHSDRLIVRYECGVSVTPDEAFEFSVTAYPSSDGDPDDAVLICNLDQETEAAFGTVRVTCGTEEIPFERVPASDGCHYFVE